MLDNRKGFLLFALLLCISFPCVRSVGANVPGFTLPPGNTIPGGDTCGNLTFQNGTRTLDKATPITLQCSCADAKNASCPTWVVTPSTGLNQTVVNSNGSATVCNTSLTLQFSPGSPTDFQVQCKAPKAENSSIALNFTTKEIVLAGGTGCSSFTSVIGMYMYTHSDNATFNCSCSNNNGTTVCPVWNVNGTAVDWTNTSSASNNSCVSTLKINLLKLDKPLLMPYCQAPNNVSIPLLIVVDDPFLSGGPQCNQLYHSPKTQVQFLPSDVPTFQCGCLNPKDPKCPTWKLLEGHDFVTVTNATGVDAKNATYCPTSYQLRMKELALRRPRVQIRLMCMASNATYNYQFNISVQRAYDGEMCNVDSDCVSAAQVCKDGNCACPTDDLPAYISVEDKCVPGAIFGGKCIYSEQCNSNVSNSLCDAGSNTCVCNSGASYNGTLCTGPPTASSSASTIGIQAVIIVVSFAIFGRAII